MLFSPLSTFSVHAMAQQQRQSPTAFKYCVGSAAALLLSSFVHRHSVRYLIVIAALLLHYLSRRDEATSIEAEGA